MGFYTINPSVLSFRNDDSKKIIFHHHIIRLENIQRISRELERGQFKITIRNLAKDLNFSINTVRKLIKDFENMEIIKCIRKSNCSNEPSIYRYIFDNKEKTTDITTNNSISDTTNNTTPDTTSDTINLSDSNTQELVDYTKVDTTNDTEKHTSKKELNKKEIYKAVIDKLNNETGKNFKATTPKTKSLIDARLRENFILEDFYIVIENKTKQWKNTDREQYLRPQTLFSSKFEGYLNEKSIIKEEIINFDENDNPWNPDFIYD